MDYYKSLNQVIKVIEENLTNKIEYKDLAKIIGTSAYTLQRIFVFLTGITLTEYIRKRRLSKAAEELISTDIKIIDLSIKYQYDSPISFSNSFKKMHGVTPKILRKDKKVIKIFPELEFTPITQIIEELEYRVITKDKQKLYGVTTGIIQSEYDKQIQLLFEKSSKEKVLDYIIQHSDKNELYYGVSILEYKDEIQEERQYYIVGKKKREDFVSIEIPKATWACFKLKNKQQDEILKLYNTIYTKWLPSSNYNEVLQYPQLEIYYENDCEICIAVK